MTSMYVGHTHRHTTDTVLSHCRVDYNLEAAESDKLLLSLLEVKDDADVDKDNTTLRTSNRHCSLFGLYPLPDRRDAPENRTPSLPPSEHQGLRLLIKVSELRYNISS